MFCAAPCGAQTVPSAVQLQSGRLLSASCMQCHSTGGFDRLEGESANEIVSELREMKTKRTPDIMHLIARGYTDQQIVDLAAYLASLRNGGETSEDDD